MKTRAKIGCAGILAVAMILFSAISLANQAEDFARIAEADVGKNGAWYGYDTEWCARVVKFWANQAGLGDSVPELYHTVQMAEWFEQQGNGFALTRRNANGEIACWTYGSWSIEFPEPDYGFVPRVGDIVFFEKNGEPEDGIDHVGVCVSVVNDYTIMAVEGNTGNADEAKSVVVKREYNWKANGSAVWGFAHLAAAEDGLRKEGASASALPGAEQSSGIAARPSSNDLYGEVREIPQNNMDAILMMDTSGSMSASSARTGREILFYAKSAALAFVEQAFSYNENYRIGFASFDSRAREIQGMTGKSNIHQLNSAINGMYAGGQTNVAAGFDEASRILDQEGRADARQIIVLFSDGIHNCSGNPVYSGEQATTGRDGKTRDIYTVGLVGALTEDGKKQVRSVLDQPYAIRYIEIDDEEQIEGVFYLLGLAAASGDVNQKTHVLRVRGAKQAQLINKRTGEMLTTGQSAAASFGSVYMTADNYEAIFILDQDEYTLRVTGGDVRTIGIVMETLDGRAVVMAQGADLRFNGNAGTRLTAEMSFADNSFTLTDESFNPYTYKGNDPFTGAYYEPEFEYKVPTGVANLPNGGLVSQRTAGYAASVPNEANMPNRVHEQHLEIFNPFFESEGFIVESRTSYGTNYDGYTYFFGGGDMKLYRVPENGGAKEKVLNNPQIAYWVDETGIYYGNDSKIVRRPHGESGGETIVRQGMATGGNLSRMIQYGAYLYFIRAKDRCICAVPYEGGDVIKLTNEPARCLTIAQLGNDEVIIYNTYDKKKKAEYLRAIDLQGDRVPALDSIQSINTHYFNYAHGYLYYCKKSEDCALYRLNLNNLSDNRRIADIHASRIFLFDDFVVTTDDSKYYCVMRPDGAEFKTIYAPYPTD